MAAAGRVRAGRDARVTAYIARAQPFARPILQHIRRVVHEAVPEVRETIKWGMPHFEYHGIICMMAGFKAHAAFGFHKGTLVTGTSNKALEAMGSFGKLHALGDLPSERSLRALVRKAAKLNAAGVKVAPVKHAKPKALRVPPDLASALRGDPKAAATFRGFPPSARRDYVEWITEAKRAETRGKRLETTIAWLREGKQRNWRYMVR